ncbi:MAG: hypothetical protein ACTHQM_02745 [Thermoanaerobaculia bacterium]
MNPINPAMMAACDVPPGFLPKPRNMSTTAVAPMAITIVPTIRTVISAR